MSPEDLRQTERFCSPQDQIQWGILSLSRHLWGLSPWGREEYLHDEWECGRQQGSVREVLQKPLRRMVMVCG